MSPPSYNSSKQLPLSIYKGTKGTKVKFHIVNAGIDISYTIFIDQHQLTLVAMDGSQVVPITADGLTIHNGERFEVEVELNQPVGRYWIRAVNPKAGIGFNLIDDGVKMNGLGILSYEGNIATSDPTSEPRECTPSNPCKIINCYFSVYPEEENKECIHYKDIKSANLENFDEHILQTPENDMIEEVFNFVIHGGASIDGIIGAASRAPAYENDLNARHQCEPECFTEGCTCFRTKSLPFNKTIQVVIANMKPFASYGGPVAPHVAHLHGHSFAVLKTAFPVADAITGKLTAPNPDIECIDDCRHVRIANKIINLNLIDPPIKDTVVIPAFGYTVVRFQSDNPGFWPLHCHMVTDLMGMSLVYTEAMERIPEIPDGFPRCKSTFSMSKSDYQTYVEDAKQKEKFPQGKNEITTPENSEDNFRNECSEGNPEDMSISYGIFTGIIFATFTLGVIVVLLVMCVHAKLHPSTSVTAVVSSPGKINGGFQ